MPAPGSRRPTFPAGWPLALMLGVVTFAVEGWAPLAARADSPAPLEVMQTPAGVRFGLLGEKQPRPAPTLMVFALDIEQTLREDAYNKVGRLLGEEGWLCVALDNPCHGADAREGEPPGLAGWRARIERGDGVVPAFCRQASAVLDHLVEQGVTDPRRVAACGTSRGGFLAMHFAAVEPRARAVAAFAPVTDLTVLREFQGLEEHPLTLSLDLVHAAGALAGRSVWLTIGNNDARVGTDKCVTLAHRLVAQAVARGKPADVELHVMPTEGHRTHATAHDEAARWLAARVAAAPPEPVAVGDRTCLFLDDRFVAERTELARVWHPARPASQPAITAREPWESWPHLFGSVIHDPADGLYKMYYENYGGRADFINTAYAESDDGRTWRKPRLGLWEFQGSKDNNIVLPQAELANVLVDPRETDPAGRLKMFVHFSYAGSELGQGYTLLQSADGRSWQRIGPGFSPAYAEETEGNYSDTNVVLWDPLAQRYMADWRSFPLSPVAQNQNNRRRGIGVSVSGGLREGWSPVVTALAADDLDDAAVGRLASDPEKPDWAEMYVMPFWTYGNHYLGLVSLLYFVDASDVRGGGDVQLAYSHDGFDWRRPQPRFSAVAPSDVPGLFPTYVSCNAPLELGDELVLYYTEANGAHPKEPFSEAVSQIRAAVWRKDGFASLDAPGGQIGSLVTVPLNWSGSRLLVNAKIDDDGELRVALLAADGSPLAGYEAGACQALRGDFTAGEVQWNGRSDLSALAPAPLRLSITVTNGSLYSFRFGP